MDAIPGEGWLFTGIENLTESALDIIWWSVPITGGESTRLTQIQSTNLFARMSPDNQHVMSYSMEDLFVMDLDGSNLTFLMPDSGGSTVDWLR